MKKLIDSEVVDLWVEEYAAKKSQQAIAVDWGVSQAVVSYHLRNRGIHPRPRGPKPTIPVREMIRLHRGGMSLGRIAERAGLGYYQRASGLMQAAGYIPQEQRRARKGRPAPFHTDDNTESMGSKKGYRYEPLTHEEQHAFRVDEKIVYCEYCEHRIKRGEWVWWEDFVGPVHAFTCDRPEPRAVPVPSWDGGLGDVENELVIPALLAELSKEQRYVIEARFGINREPETLAALGRTLKVSKQRVHQIEEQALRHLRALLATPEPAPEPELPSEPGIVTLWRAHQDLDPIEPTAKKEWGAAMERIRERRIIAARIRRGRERTRGIATERR